MQIIVGRRDQAAAAAAEFRRPVELRKGQGLEHTFLTVQAIDHGGAVALGRRHVEIGVVHAERLEDPLDQDFAEGLAFDAADQKAQNIGRMAVVEALAGLIEQRQRGQLRHPCVGRPGMIEHVSQHALIFVRDRAHGGKSVGKTGAMREEVVEGDLARGRHGLIERSLGVLQHAHRLELGREFRDGVGEFEPALLHQHQGRDGGDRLGHRGDAEQGVARHRQLLFDVAMADGVDLRHLAMAPQQSDEAREVAGFGDGRERGRDLGEALSREALGVGHDLVHRLPQNVLRDGGKEWDMSHGYSARRVSSGSARNSVQAPFVITGPS